MKESSVKKNKKSNLLFEHFFVDSFCVENETKQYFEVLKLYQASVAPCSWVYFKKLVRFVLKKQGLDRRF